MVGLVCLAVLVASCAVPVAYGPYYHPTYQGLAEEARIAPPGKSPTPPSVLWIEPGNRQCRFVLWADADEADLVLSWSIWYGIRIKESLPCKVIDTPLDAPLLIQDLDTGQKISVRRLRMVERHRFGAPHLDIRQEVDLASLIPGFSSPAKGSNSRRTP